MQLTRLTITEFPGIPTPREYTFPELITVLHGPNASGKSSSARAIFALFDPRIAAGEPVSITATFISEGHEYVVKRRQDSLTWHKDGKRIRRPATARDLDINSHFLTVKNLLHVGETEDELEQQVLIELTGGVDLPAIAKALTLSRSAGQTEATALRNATAHVNELLTQREQLAQQEAQLEQQQQRLRELRAAQAEAPLLERARERAQLRSKLGQHQAMRSTLAPVHEAFTPDRADNLARQAAAIDNLAKRRDELDKQYEALTFEVNEFPRVKEATQRLQAALDIEDELSTLRNSEAHDAAKAESLGAAVDRHRAMAEQYTVTYNPELLRAHNIEHTFTLIEQADQRAAELTVLRERLKQVQHEAEDAPDNNAAKLHTRRDRLAQWLHTQPAGISFVPTLLACLVVLLLAGAAWFAWPISYEDNPALSIIAGLVGVGAIATAVTSWAVLRRDGRVRTARSEIAATLGNDIQSEAHAGQLFAEVHENLALQHAKTERHQQLTALQHALEQDIERVTAAHNEALAALSEAVGYEAGSATGVARRAVHLRQQLNLYESLEAYEETKTKVEALRKKIRARQEQQAELLEPFAFTAVVSKRQLEERLSTEQVLAQKRGERGRIGQELARLSKQVIDERMALLAELPNMGVAVPEGFRYFDIPELLATQRANWPDFAQWRDEADDLARQLAYTEQHLADYPEVLAIPEDEVEERLRNIPEITEAAEALHREIARTEAALDTAKRDRAIERARQVEQLARQELADHQSVVLADTAAQFVISDVIRTSYEEQEPRTLTRAAEWFRTFTQGAFELRYRPVQSGEESSALVAWDVQLSEERSLSELSSGTLSQLLLAARIGFALEREATGAPVLPFVLDEALGTADNERFTAVARSLHLFSSETGRQLLYLSARAEDMHAWQHVNPEVHIITLPQEG